MTEIEAYIRQAAAELGIDPDVAVAVARSEGGLNNPVRQSDYVKNGRRETSYGPFQLLIGGGVGDKALKAGIDPRNPEQWREATKFGLQEAKRSGWGQWYGAAKSGISNWEGLGGKPAGQYNLPPVDPLGSFDTPSAAASQQPPGSIAGIGSPDTYATTTPFRDSPGGPVEAAGGGAGSEAGQTTWTPPAAKEEDAPKNWWELLGEGIGDAAGAMGATKMPGYNLPAQPGPARVDVGAAPYVDPQRQEMQRQQLAMAMQRLNQGVLF